MSTKHICTNCRKRKAGFVLGKGRRKQYSWNQEHNLCSRCYRSQCQRLIDWGKQLSSSPKSIYGYV